MKDKKLKMCASFLFCAIAFFMSCSEIEDGYEIGDGDGITGISATAQSSNSISIRWQSVSSVTQYYIHRSPSFSGTYSQVGTTTSTSWTNTGLSSGTTYCYRVTANNAGTTLNSRRVCATTR